MIYSTEKRDTVIADIPGAYLTIEINEEMLMIIGKSSKQILYMKLKSALFSFLRRSLLFLNNLSFSMIDEDYTLNLYDQWVADKIIEGK